MAEDKNKKFLKTIKCFYTGRVGFGTNIHGFLDQQAEVRNNHDGTRSIIKYPPVPKRAKVDKDGYFEVLDHVKNREKLKGLITSGMVRVLDEDVEFEIMGENKIEKFTEIVEEIVEEKVPILPEDGKIAFNRKRAYGPEEKKRRQEIAAKARETKLQKQRERIEKEAAEKAALQKRQKEEVESKEFVENEMANEDALEFIDSEG